jgi:alcohol dehydrogenase, propanol-preferring
MKAFSQIFQTSQNHSNRACHCLSPPPSLSLCPGLTEFFSSPFFWGGLLGKKKHSLGPHAVILVAVAEKPFQQAAEYVRPRGSVVAIGLPADAYLRAPVFGTVVRMISIKGSYVGNRKDSAEAIQFFAEGKIHAPVKIVGLSELQNVYQSMEEGKVVGRIVVDTSK